MFIIINFEKKQIKNREEIRGKNERKEKREKRRKRGGKREEKKGILIVVKKRENILILFPCLIGPCSRQKGPQKNRKEFQKCSGGGRGRFSGGYNIS